MNFLQVGGALLLAAGFASAQTPSIAAVVNNASGILQGLPNAGIAQGSIFLVVGTSLGPDATVVSTAPFQSASLAGTSVTVTGSGGASVNVPLYYSSATQVSALLPSNTALGAATITVTYNNTVSSSAPLLVVQNNVGIFTLGQNGQGAGIVTYADYSLVSAVKGSGNLGAGGPGTYGGSANPGDTLILWTTGLGPVSGNELSGSGLGVDMPSIPLMVWVGGVQANVTYRGRSGCCIGEDQIVFTIPSGAPTGCAVPLAVQIGSLVSNYTVLPIASNGRSCTPSNPALTSDAVQTLTTGTGTSYGLIQLRRQVGGGTNGFTYQDQAQGQFARITTDPLLQAVLPTYFDNIPMGTCTTYNTLNPSNTPPSSTFAGLDAGKVTVAGPSGTQTLQEKPSGGQPTQYVATLSQTGTYFSGGAYTVSGAGGTDVGAFSGKFTVTATPVWTSANQFQITSGVTRNNGMTINWTAGSSNYYLEIDGRTATDSTGILGAGFTCLLPSTGTSFTVPASVLLALPGSPYGEVDFKPTLNPVSILPASGLNFGSVTLNYDTSAFPSFQ